MKLALHITAFRFFNDTLCRLFKRTKEEDENMRLPIIIENHLRHQICVNDDLISEILQRLPNKSLLRFKSVCKPWKKMIEEPYLALKQLPRTIHEDTDKKLVMVHYSMSGTKQFSSVISKEMIEIATPENQNHDLDCDCNGLYLFCNDRDNSLPLSLFNPVTQETIQLPHASPSAHPQSKHIREVHGLGFDVGNAVFKVIRFTMDVDYMCRKPEILILGQKTWKQFELPACLHGIPCRGTIFLNGAIHCLFRIADRHHNFVVGFDVMKEEFRLVKFPDTSLACCKIVNIGGSIAMMARPNDAAPDENYNVYLLKDYNKGEWCVRADLKLKSAPYSKKRLAVSGFILNQVILYNCGSNLFFDVETRQRTVKEMTIDIAKVSPILVNAQLSLVPLSQYKTSD